MFSLENLQRLKDMRAYVAEAHDLIQGKIQADLERDRLLNLAVVRLLEVVGEAASRISREDCTCHPEISWAEIVGLRNRLIRGYGQVDFDIVWQILTVDLSPLIEHLDRIIAEQERLSLTLELSHPRCIAINSIEQRWNAQIDIQFLPVQPHT
jgi:uncharacterized protein with HEPN domain